MAKFTGSFSIVQHAHLSTIACAVVVLYSLALCLITGSPTVTEVAMDAAMTLLMDWCYPCMCQFLILSLYQLVVCCLPIIRAPKKLKIYMIQASDSLMPVLRIISAVVALLWDCTVFAMTGTLYILMVAIERCTSHQTTPHANPNVPQPENVNTILTDLHAYATAKCLSVATKAPVNNKAAEVNIWEPETPERQSEAWDGNSQPELSESADTSSSSSSSTSANRVAAMAAAYERKLAMAFVSRKAQVTAALPGTVEYFRWSFELQIEACNVCATAAAAKPRASS